MNAETQDKLHAAQGVVDTCIDMFFDNAEAFTCGEAEAIAQLLKSFDFVHTAEEFIEAHGRGDDEGDNHYTGEENEDDE